MKKLFNYRPLIFVAFACVSGLILPILFFKNNLYIILLSIPTICLVISLFFKKSRYWLYKNVIFVFSLILVFILGVFSWSIFENIQKNDKFVNGKYTVSGFISSINNQEENDYILVEVSRPILTKGNYSKTLRKEMTLFVSTKRTEIFVAENIGDYIEFDAFVVYKDIYDMNEIDARSVLYGVSATTSIESDYQVETYNNNKPSIVERIRLNVRNILHDNMDSNTAALNYAMLFGDTSGIDTQTRDNYSVSGIYHLLAVSGLNVGFLVVVLNFIMSIIRLPKKYRTIINSLFILMYAWLCSFTPSVSRASIMAIIGLYAIYRGKQYDGVNSLALSLIVILLISPENMFDIGLYLSFAAVLSIIMLTPSISSFFEKFLTKNISTTISMTLAAQIGTLPILIKYFEKISIYGVFSNILAVPLASIGFMVLFVSVPLVMIMPFLGIVLKLPEYILYAITVIADAFASIKFAVVNVKYSLIASTLFYAGVFIWGDLFFIKQKWSYVLPAMLGSAAVVLSLFV